MNRKSIHLTHSRLTIYICQFAILLSVLLLAGCAGEKHPHGQRRSKASLLTPTSSGNSYEVMVVADDSVYKGYAGKALQTILDYPLLGLPQAEPQFHKSHITQKSYNKITNIFRNIVRINISREYTKAKMTVEHDVHSTPQLIITVQGPNQVVVSQYITEHTRDITSLITSQEINTMANNLYYEHNVKFAKKVKEMFDCELYIPVDINKMKIGKDFIWASDDGLSVIQNICIYSLPYVSEKMLTRNPYIALRDKVMAENIPGGHEGSVMRTNHEFVWTKNIRVRDDVAMEARGLWEMSVEAMGGPFVSHSRIDTVNSRIIVVEGFVYAPDKMKRTMLRRLEAALYTLELPTDTKTKQQ
ncbi:MAG: DUF4837 family protein [Bacteroidaceae bacterium]|nr:DUF4837 family protein [Bacteroidaceae bacterium]